MQTFALTPRPARVPDRSTIMAFRAPTADAIRMTFPKLAGDAQPAEPSALHGLTKLWSQCGIEVWGYL